MIKPEERPHPLADEWKHKDPSELTLPQKVILKRGVLNPNPKEFTYPKLKGKVPVVLEWEQHKRLFPLLVLPSLLRWAFMRATRWSVHPVIAYFFTVAFNIFVSRSMFKYFRELTIKYGFLDGEIGRDSLPEALTSKVFKESLFGVFLRPLMVFSLSYDRHALPQLSWWFPVQIAVFSLIVDFCYYWVHRATHQYDSLWKYHQRHHTTKHPSFYLLALADEPQEMFDLFVSPVVAYMFYPLNFDTLYIWSMYFYMVEILGHSGMRIYYPGVLTSTLLRPFDAEITAEDHDLHHRHGWRECYNYGKQSMLWDTIFGTRGDRVELRKDNIEWDSRLS